MRTDKELFKVFEAVPDWVFPLTGLPSPGKCRLQSLAIKSLERAADAVIVPEATDQSLTVVGFQFQKDETDRPRPAAQAKDPRRVRPSSKEEGIA